MPLYDYLCKSGHITEARRGYDVTSIPCAACGQNAQRRSVYRFGVTGVPHPKYRLSEYQEAASEANYYHDKIENDCGGPLPRVPVVNMAAQKARQRGAKVRTIPKGV